MSQESMSLANSRICVGQIRQAHGIQGWVKVFSYTQPRSNVFQYGPFFTSETQASTLKLKQFKEQPKGLLALFEGVSDRNQAEKLFETNLYVDASSLPKLQANEYYIKDLLGFEVVNTNQQLIGVLKSSFDTAAHTVLEVKGSAEEVLIPWHSSVVVEVNLEQTRLVVDWELD